MPSEFDLIARYFVHPTPNTVLGPGDDCAVIAPSQGMSLSISTDMLVSGTHFFPDTDPYRLGWKTLAVNVSDLAAMGARPRWALLSLSLPKVDEAFLSAFSQGFLACAKAYDLELIGGDTTRGPLNFCVTIIGETPHHSALTRRGAHIGDDVWVSGMLGRAALGLSVLSQGLILPETLARDCILALEKPIPRVSLGEALRHERLAHAAIDISDGLLADIGHIAECSNVNITLWEKALPPLPHDLPDTLITEARAAQCHGGDDYELGFTAPVSARERISTLSQTLTLPLWRIGRVIEAPVAHSGLVFLENEAGERTCPTQKGFDHFA